MTALGGAPPITTSCWPTQPLWICLKGCSSTASTPTSLTTLTTTAPSPDCLAALPPKGPLHQAPRLSHRSECATPARCCTHTRWTCLAPPTTWTRMCASLPTGLPNARPRPTSPSRSWQPGDERAGPKAGVVVAGEFRLPGRTASWVHGVATYLPSTSRGTDLLASTAAAHVTSVP